MASLSRSARAVSDQGQASWPIPRITAPSNGWVSGRSCLLEAHTRSLHGSASFHSCCRLLSVALHEGGPRQRLRLLAGGLPPLQALPSPRRLARPSQVCVSLPYDHFVYTRESAMFRSWHKAVPWESPTPRPLRRARL